MNKQIMDRQTPRAGNSRAYA